ncbi:unnamed protein product [Prorocentrum cordatum]|uniref:FACT complex subunit n=1 Tax=Prorocentrum cordatum TaxID=2364126 RepID=A0ABN9SD23_9DINO|nr:unnamed protein product [Polarella glacialis]
MPKQQQLDRLGFLRHFRKLSQSAHLWPYDVLVIVTGKAAWGPGDSQKKSTAFIHWLFGLFFPEVAVALTRTGMVVLTSAKKVECLRQLCAQTDGDPEVDLVTRAPGDVLDQAQLAEVWQQVVGRSRLQGSIRVGTLLQERKKGEFATSFQNALATLPRVAEVFECQEQISTVLSTKDAIELQSVRKAAGIVTALMSSVFISNLESVVDDEQQSTHKEVADTVIAALETPGRLQGVVALESAEVGELELQYVSLQSGSGVRLAPFIESTVGDLPMHGTYLVNSLGLTCEEYSACIARTLLVDPVDEARQAYDLLNEVHGQVLRNLIPGMPFKDVYSAAANFVASRSTVLKSKFSDSVGFVTGIEFRDPLLVINASSPYKVEAGMTLCLSVGFSSPGPETWAVWIADTVELQEGTDSCGVNLTAGCSILPSDVVFDTGDPAMPPGEAAEDGGDASQGAEVAEEAAPAAAADGLPAPAAAEPAPAPDAVEPAEDRPRGTANPGSGAADPAREPAGDASSAEEAGPVRKRPAARGGRGGRGRDAGRGRAGASAEDGCEASSQARGAERSPADATPPSLPKRRGAADPEGEPAGGADEGRPVRKRPAAAESQADALAEGAERTTSGARAAEGVK